MTGRRLLAAALFVLLALAGASLFLFRGSERAGSTTESSESPPLAAAAAPPPEPTPPQEPPDQKGGGTGTGFGRGGHTGEPPAPRRVADRFDEVDSALGELVQGRVAFNTPERMRYGESRPVALVASPTMAADTLSTELRSRIGGADPVEIATLQIAPLMEARLEGAPAFEITALTPAEQPVSRSAPTEWRWTIRATQTGRHQLHLTINAILTVAGERYPRSLRVLNRDIKVDITAGQRIGLFLGKNWQWLAGTVVIRLAVWFWNRRRKKRRR